MADLQDRLIKAKQMIRALEEELHEADHGLIALTAELEARAERLEESEQRFRLMVEGSEEVFFFEHDSDHRFTYLSPSVRQVLGYDPEELLGEPYEVLLTGDPSDAAVTERTEDALGSGERGNGYTAVVRHRDGRAVVLELVERPITRNGGVAGIQGFARDVTERKRDEEALRETTRMLHALVDASPAAIYVLDPAEHVVLWNPAAERMFGWRSVEVLGRPVPLGGDEQDDTFGELHRSALEGTAASALDLPWVRKDGSPVELSVSVAPLGEDGSPSDEPASVGIVAVVVDVTERKAAERALRESELQLRHAQKMEAVGRLAGGVAHDFNNALTAIKGHTQFALEALADGPAAGELREVLKASDWAANLTRQLLAFSRRQVTEPKVLDVAEVVGGIERILRRLVSEEIDLEVSLDSGLSRIRMDPTHLEQVLVNLAMNARDAMPQGGELRVEGRNAELGDDASAYFGHDVRPGRYVLLSVSDTGTGMPKETVERIFEPFFTTKQRGEGTGLGLSMVYGIVKQADGYIKVDSEPGAGTTFGVYLPRTEERIEAEQRPAAAAEADLDGSETILLVEDQKSVRALVRRVLDRAGYRVLEADNGMDALRLFGELDEPIHLLLTDVVMPRMGGRELAARLRESHPGLRVLFMSGYAEDEIAHRGILDPGTHLIEKPFESDALKRKVREVLSGGAGAP